MPAIKTRYYKKLEKYKNAHATIETSPCTTATGGATTSSNDGATIDTSPRGAGKSSNDCAGATIDTSPHATLIGGSTTIDTSPHATTTGGSTTIDTSPHIEDTVLQSPNRNDKGKDNAGSQFFKPHELW